MVVCRLTRSINGCHVPSRTDPYSPCYIRDHRCERFCFYFHYTKKNISVSWVKHILNASCDAPVTIDVTHRSWLERKISILRAMVSMETYQSLRWKTRQGRCSSISKWTLCGNLCTWIKHSLCISMAGRLHITARWDNRWLGKRRSSEKRWWDLLSWHEEIKPSAMKKIVAVRRKKKKARKNIPIPQ